MLILLSLAVVSVLARDLPSEGAANSFTTVILLACLPIFGPIAAGVLALITALVDRAYGMSIVPVFNGLMMGNMTLLGGMVFLYAGGCHPVPSGMTPLELLRCLGLPLLAADLVMCLVNVLVLSGMVAITGGHPRAVLWGSVRELVPLYLGYGLIAFIFVLLWEPAGVGPLSAALIAAPLTIARFVYVQYGDKVRAHDRILGMFTAVADNPDHRVRAHARRVGELCQLTAAQLGLGETERRVLDHAAVVHDLGMKSVVRATDTDKGGSGPYTNVRALLPHPVFAVEMIQGIDFLTDVAPVVRGHHERVDGRGYPDGLVGEEIPLLARILAVADAFDALTTTRGEREALDAADALRELRLSAGTHLDADVVDALSTAMRGRPWPSRVDNLVEGSWLWDHHTLPAMSDVIADELHPLPADPVAGQQPAPDDLEAAVEARQHHVPLPHTTTGEARP